MTYGADGETRSPNSVDQKAQAALIHLLEHGTAIVRDEKIADRVIELGMSRRISKRELPSGNYELKRENS